MPVKEASDSAAEETGIGNTPFAIDISKIEASDSIQSHVSQTTSSKRFRIYSSTGVGKAEEVPDVWPLGLHDGHNNMQIFWARLLGESTHIPLSLRATRQDHTWASSIVYRAGILYCLLSCVIAVIHLFTNILNPAIHAMTTRKFARSGNIPVNIAVTQYLTRTLVASTSLEPFVLNVGSKTPSNVTICAWLPDSKLRMFEKWRQSWQGSVSLLVTTNHTASSSSHRKLLKLLRQLSSNPWMKGVSIHLLHVKEHGVGSPNVYLNLARLFASTDWVLIIPGELDSYAPPKVADIISPNSHTSEYVLVSGNHSYPFPEISPLLIRRDRDFWCTERTLAGKSRSPDWNECLWQLNLETSGALKSWDVLMMVSTPKTDEGDSISEKLIAKYRGEICNSVINQMSMTRAGNRNKELELDWVKSFCRKSVDRKREL